MSLLENENCRAKKTGAEVDIATLFTPASAGSTRFTGACGRDASACCIIVACAGPSTCSGLSYSATFKGTVNAGAVAGIVIGAIVLFAVAAAVCRARAIRRAASGGSGGAYSAFPAQQPYGGGAVGYAQQQPSYAEPPPAASQAQGQVWGQQQPYYAEPPPRPAPAPAQYQAQPAYGGGAVPVFTQRAGGAVEPKFW